MLGRDAETIEKNWRDLVFLTHPAIAIAAFDTGRRDLRSYQLAGIIKASIPLYRVEECSLHVDAATRVNHAIVAKGEGFGGAKLTVGRPLHKDLSRLRTVHWVEYIPQLDSITSEDVKIENGLAFPCEQLGLSSAWGRNATRARTTVSGDIR